jgi:hypothetical protein
MEYEGVSGYPRPRLADRYHPRLESALAERLLEECDRLGTRLSLRFGTGARYDGGRQAGRQQ